MKSVSFSSMIDTTKLNYVGEEAPRHVPSVVEDFLPVRNNVRISSRSKKKLNNSRTTSTVNPFPVEINQVKEENQFKKTIRINHAEIWLLVLIPVIIVILLVFEKTLLSIYSAKNIMKFELPSLSSAIYGISVGSTDKIINENNIGIFFSKPEDGSLQTTILSSISLNLTCLLPHSIITSVSLYLDGSLFHSQNRSALSCSNLLNVNLSSNDNFFLSAKPHILSAYVNVSDGNTTFPLFAESTFLYTNSSSVISTTSETHSNQGSDIGSHNTSSDENHLTNSSPILKSLPLVLSPKELYIVSPNVNSVLSHTNKEVTLIVSLPLSYLTIGSSLRICLLFDRQLFDITTALLPVNNVSISDEKWNNFHHKINQLFPLESHPHQKLSGNYIYK